MTKICAFIITHGNLAKEIRDVTRNFFDPNLPLYTYSNARESIENISSDVEQKVLEQRPDKIIIFVDLMGGSCWQAAMRVKKNHSHAAIISGINVPVLVSFASNHERFSWDELLEKITSDGRKGIQLKK